MPVYVVEARNGDIAVSLFFEVAASSADDACQRVAKHYEREGWAPASTYVAQRAARPRTEVRLLYRQHWPDVKPAETVSLEGESLGLAEPALEAQDTEGLPVAVGARGAPQNPPPTNT